MEEAAEQWAWRCDDYDEEATMEHTRTVEDMRADSGEGLAELAEAG